MPTIPLRIAICLPLALFLATRPLSAAATTQPAIPVHIHILTYPELPLISGDRLTTILNRASKKIARDCGQRVEFVISDDGDAAFFASKRRDAIAPYVVESDQALDPFTTDADTYIHRYDSALNQKYSKSEIVKIAAQLGLTDPYPYTAISWQLARQHVASWKPLLKVLDIHGQPVLTRDNWPIFSLGHWYVFLMSMDWTNDLNVYLTNGLLVDTDPGNTTPLYEDASMVANSLTIPGSNAVIGYYAVMSPTLNAGNPNLAAMTPADRDLALVYIIAQSVGVHLLLCHDVETRAGAGIARYIRSLPDIESLRDVAHWPLKDQSVSIARLRKTQMGKAESRMAIFGTDRNMQALYDEVRHSDALDLTAQQHEAIHEFLRSIERRLNADH